MVVVILINFVVPCDPVSTLVNGHFAAVATTQHNYPPTNALLCCRIYSSYLQQYFSFPPLPFPSLPFHSFLQLYYTSSNLIFPLFLISSLPYPSLPYPSVPYPFLPCLSLPFLSLPSSFPSPFSSLRSLPFPKFPQALQTLAIFQGKSVRSGREGFNPILADSIFPRCLHILRYFCIHQYIPPPLLLFIFLSTHTH